MQKFAKQIAAVFLSAYSWVFILAVSGVLAVCYGAFLIFGAGISFIILGGFLLVFMAMIARGAANG